MTVGPYKLMVTSFTWPAHPQPGKPTYVATAFPSEAPVEVHKHDVDSLVWFMLQAVNVIVDLLRIKLKSQSYSGRVDEESDMIRCRSMMTQP